MKSIEGATESQTTSRPVGAYVCSWNGLHVAGGERHAIDVVINPHDRDAPPCSHFPSLVHDQISVELQYAKLEGHQSYTEKCVGIYSCGAAPTVDCFFVHSHDVHCFSSYAVILVYVSHMKIKRANGL